MGKLAKIKTTQNTDSVAAFLNTITGEQKRKDSAIILALMQKATGEQPKMWGSSMIGFGLLRYTSPATGRQVDWFKIGFAPRKANLSLHLMNLAIIEEPLTRLGKYKTGKGCLYINKLDDVDLTTLEEIIHLAAK